MIVSGAFGPDEGLWVVIGFGEEAVDGGLEIDDGSEDASFKPSLGQFGEETLDGVEPGGYRASRHDFGAPLTARRR
jgi:hypothetical protein